MGHLDNTKRLIFWLCYMKQLNFRHFNTIRKKFHCNSKFQPARNKNGSKKANIIMFGIPRSFQPFSDDLQSFRKISEGYGRFPKTAEDFQGEIQKFRLSFVVIFTCVRYIFYSVKILFFQSEKSL